MNPFFFSSTFRFQETAKFCCDPESFLIRGGASKDLVQLADILAESFHSRNGFGGWVYPLLRMGIYEDLRNRFRSGPEHYICLVAEVVSPPVGAGEVLAGTVEMAVRERFVSPHLLDRPPWQLVNPQYPYLSNLAVHPDYRRRGVAQQLLSKCEQKALQWGFSELYLHVLENNHAARRLYYQAGYRLDRVDWSWSSLLLGQPKRLFLRKRLTGEC